MSNRIAWIAGLVGVLLLGVVVFQNNWPKPDDSNPDVPEVQKTAADEFVASYCNGMASAFRSVAGGIDSMSDIEANNKLAEGQKSARLSAGAVIDQQLQKANHDGEWHRDEAKAIMLDLAAQFERAAK